MNFGQADSEALADNRGIVPDEQAKNIRRLRVAEMWERYDSVVIGPGASDKSKGWFNTWADFAGADVLQWFSGRDTNAGPAFVNQTTERTDWAQDFYYTRIEFISPPGMADIETEPNDAQITPTLFAQQFPTQMSIKIVMSDADEIAKAPANHFPAGHGVTNPIISAAAAPSVIAGGQGDPHISNGWRWPDPVMLAAKAKVTVIGGIDAPLRAMLSNLPGPGYKNIPIGDGEVHAMPNWYVIKVTHGGPRYLQLRGARSSA